MKIVTLTLNPALDKSAKVDGIAPDHKLKCHSYTINPEEEALIYREY